MTASIPCNRQVFNQIRPGVPLLAATEGVPRRKEKLTGTAARARGPGRRTAGTYRPAMMSSQVSSMSWSIAGFSGTQKLVPSMRRTGSS